jgi:membrane-associated phospholipid phosphatase
VSSSVIPRSPLQRRLAQALAVVLLLFVTLGLVIRPSRIGDTIDERTLDVLEPLRVADDAEAWAWATQFGNPVSYALFLVALVLTALLRSRPRWALVVPVTMVLSGLTAQGLKRLLADPRPGVVTNASIGDAAWPSGHSAAAMTVALLAILLAPRRLRPMTAVLGAGLALMVGLGMVVTGFHYPTDIFGGYLCAAGWVLAAALVMLEWQRRRPVATPADRRPLRLRHVAGPVLLLALGVLTAAALASRDDTGLVGTLRDHTVAVAMLGGIVALALTLVALTASLPEAGENAGSLDGKAGPDR